MKNGGGEGCPQPGPLEATGRSGCAPQGKLDVFAGTGTIPIRIVATALRRPLHASNRPCCELTKRKSTPGSILWLEKNPLSSSGQWSPCPSPSTIRMDSSSSHMTEANPTGITASFGKD